MRHEAGPVRSGFSGSPAKEEGSARERGRAARRAVAALPRAAGGGATGPRAGEPPAEWGLRGGVRATVKRPPLCGWAEKDTTPLSESLGLSFRKGVCVCVLCSRA